MMTRSEKGSMGVVFRFINNFHYYLLELREKKFYFRKRIGNILTKISEIEVPELLSD